jgi:LysM repeat protein
MKSTASTFAFGAALAAAALLAPGCRTIHRGQKPAEPGPANVVQADGVAPQSVVLDAKDVGKPGTYPEFVIPENADRSYAVEADGLTGQTGRHVSAQPPTPDPAPVATPVVAPVAPGAASVYVVQDGDIFGRIAQKHGVSQKALRDANPGLKNPDKLFVGQKLNVPPRGTGLGASAPKKTAKKAAQKKAATLPPKAGYTVYVVQEGDILGRIANRHKTTVKAIQEANGIADPTKLRAGTAIYVPSAAAAPAPAPEETVAPPPPPTAPADPAPAGDDFLGTFGV